MQKRRQMWHCVCSPISAMRISPWRFFTITATAITNGREPRLRSRSRRLRTTPKFRMPLVPSAGRWDEAIANFEKARYLDPRNFSVISNLAETLIAMRRYAEAQHAIDNALLVNPNAHFFSIQRASIDLKKNGDTAPLRAALDAIPRDFDPVGAVTTVRIRLNLMERDFAKAARM